MRRRYRVRPSRGVLVVYTVIGAVITCFGVFFAIPATWNLGSMVLFNLLWTGIAVYNTISGLMMLLGKKEMRGFSGMEVYEEDEASETAPASTAAARLQELRSLYDRSLITEEEYEAKRQEILKEL